jgi:hypothetical protein
VSVTAWLAVAVFVTAYAFIATEKIHRVVAAVGGASVMLLIGATDAEHAFFSEESGIDWNVIFLLLGMMLIVSVMKRTGVAADRGPDDTAIQVHDFDYLTFHMIDKRLRRRVNPQSPVSATVAQSAGRRLASASDTTRRETAAFGLRVRTYLPYWAFEPAEDRSVASHWSRRRPARRIDAP